MITQEEINQRLDVIESDMQKLVAENLRLIRERESAFVELDSCVGLIMQLAVANGLKAGLANENTVVLDLPSGQVSWHFEASEAHLFEFLPEYDQPIEEIDVLEKYRRVMNPNLISS